jgi:hypothetical protein
MIVIKAETEQDFTGALGAMRLLDMNGWSNRVTGSALSPTMSSNIRTREIKLTFPDPSREQGAVNEYKERLQSYHSVNISYVPTERSEGIAQR